MISKHDKSTTGRLRARRGLVAGIMLGAVGLTSAPFAQAGHAAKPQVSATINVGTKNFAEEYLVSDMYKLLLQKKGFKVNLHDLAQTPILHKALLRGSIDLYPEYTGTGLGTVLGRKKAVANPIQAYNQVKSAYRRFGLTWLAQSPFNDTNSIAVTQATARKYNLRTISDLAKVANQLSFAGLPDCKDRPDCLGGLKSVYGINFKSIAFVDSQPVMYKGVNAGTYDVIEVFTTDAPIKALNLAVLRDNKGIFPADHIAPVVRNSILKKYPVIQPTLNRLTRYLTLNAMKRLNGMVILQEKDHMTVARQFLRSKGLI